MTGPAQSCGRSPVSARLMSLLTQSILQPSGHLIGTPESYQSLSPMGQRETPSGCFPGLVQTQRATKLPSWPAPIWCSPALPYNNPNPPKSGPGTSELYGQPHPGWWGWRNVPSSGPLQPVAHQKRKRPLAQDSNLELACSDLCYRPGHSQCKSPPGLEKRRTPRKKICLTKSVKPMQNFLFGWSTSHCPAAPCAASPAFSLKTPRWPNPPWQSSLTPDLKPIYNSAPPGGHHRWSRDDHSWRPYSPLVLS